MSLLALLTTKQTPPTPDPEPDADLPAVEDAPIPYTMPTAAPWNAPVRAIVPTYDGSDEPTHPGVVDMVAETGKPWKGYRYWMVHTPYPGWNALYENPSVVVSNNGFDWHDTAVGISNPIIPQPAGGGYNSDNDLVWDPDLQRLWMIYRTNTRIETLSATWTTNGVTWADPVVILPTPTGQAGMVSPAIVKTATGWRTFGVDAASKRIVYRDSASPGAPLGPLNTTTETRNGVGDTSPYPWHLDVLPADDAGVMYGLIVTDPMGSIYPITSRDNGQSWVYGPAVLNASKSGWDRRQMYRPTLTRDGDMIQVWYSHNGDQNSIPAGIGYTRIPLSLWP